MHPREVHFLGEAVEDGHVELVEDVAEVLADHLLRQSLPGDEKPCDGLRGIFQKSSSDKIGDSLVRLLVEDVEAGPVVTLPDDLVDGVAVADVGRR